MTRKLGGLIKPACKKTPPVQRHGHDAITRGNRTIACPQHPRCHQQREIGTVEIFELVDELSGGAIMDGGRSQALEWWRLGDGFGAENARAMVMRERNAQHLAIGPLDECHLRPALCTKCSAAFGHTPATHAGSRVDEIS